MSILLKLTCINTKTTVLMTMIGYIYICIINNNDKQRKKNFFFDFKNVMKKRTTIIRED